MPKLYADHRDSEYIPVSTKEKAPQTTKAPKYVESHSVHMRTSVGSKLSIYLDVQQWYNISGPRLFP